MNKYLSVVTPVYNESKSLKELVNGIIETLGETDFEIVAVDDGSSDDSAKILEEMAKNEPRLKVIALMRNFGQTAAINAGIRNAIGDLVILMDSDLENDPNDIPRLISKLEEGYDVVSGWRKDRWKGQWLRRRLPSNLANFIIRKISGVKIHDFGCTLKGYRREVLKHIFLYGEMHRFIPVYCKWQGGRLTEIEVNYKKRQYGSSNYGLGRIFKVVLDLMLIAFMDRYMQKPIHFFGGAGLWSMIAAVISIVVAIYFKVTNAKDFVETPLPVLAAMFFIVGILMIMIGIIAEMLMRTYYESQNKSPYIIRRKTNI